MKISFHVTLINVIIARFGLLFFSESYNKASGRKKDLKKGNIELFISLTYQVLKYLKNRIQSLAFLYLFIYKVPSSNLGRKSPTNIIHHTGKVNLPLSAVQPIRTRVKSSREAACSY